MTMPERVRLDPEYPGFDGQVVGFLDGNPDAADWPLYVNATPRPMSEAPRDGTKVLAWWPGDGQDGSGWISTWWMKNSNGWMCLWDFAAPDEPHAPTHFLPHPEEPK